MFLEVNCKNGIEMKMGGANISDMQKIIQKIPGPSAKKGKLPQDIA